MYQLQLSIKLVLTILFLHIACHSRLYAQLKNGSYIGESNGFNLTIQPDGNAVLYYRYETTVNLRFNCKLIVDSDSTFSLANLARVRDTVIIQKTQRKKVERPIIYFEGLNEAGDHWKMNIDYRIEGKPGGRQVLFSYEHLDYVYPIGYNAKKVLIVIDVKNSFFLSKWKYSQDTLFPMIRNKVVTQWVSVLK